MRRRRSDAAGAGRDLSDPYSPGTPGGGPAVAGVVGGAAGASVMTDPRSNSLLVRAPNASRLASIRALVDKLDRPSQGTGACLFSDGARYQLHFG